MSRSGFSIRLFGGFELRQGELPVDVPQSGQRLLTFMALHPRPLPRRHVADTLWPDAAEQRAQANLRTTLWRLHAQRLDLFRASSADLGLSPDVSVDTRMLDAAAGAFRRTGRLPDPATLLDLRGELLPGHWDAWLVFDRERLRHEAVHLLESSCEACLRRSESQLAILLGLCAVDCDPLRESANVLVVKAHLARGDTAGAIRHARHYARVVADELGIAPPAFLEELLFRSAKAPAPVLAGSAAGVAG